MFQDQPKRLARALQAAALVLCTIAGAALAQSYPSRHIRFVVPFPPGGVHDTFARVIQPRLGEALGQQVIIENRPGAGGNVAAQAVAKALPDGYTLLVAIDSIAVASHLYRDPGFDVFRDFAPITKLANFPMALAASLNSEATTVGELVARARSMPGKVNIASMGPGTPGHLIGEQFKVVAGIDLLHVPYNGAGPAMNELVAGRVNCVFVNLAVAMPLARSGKIRILGVAHPTRIGALPGVPTIAESGYRGLEVSTYSGLLAPAATPEDIVRRLNQDAGRVLRSAEVQARLVDLAGEATPTSPAEYRSFLRGESERWGKLIRSAGIRAD